MSVWLTIPSARPAEQVEPVLKQWRAMGYRICLWRDEEDVSPQISKRCDIVIGSAQEYPGYAQAVNQLIKVADMYSDASAFTGGPAEWFVAAGDDTLPDPNKPAQQIAHECGLHFAELHAQIPDGAALSVPMLKQALHGLSVATFGVMQPTGDRWHEGCGGFQNAPIDRVCGSPWLGREFCRRMYQGTGPYWPGYGHQFVDEELQNVALKYGVLWQRRDLTQRHNHWGRGATDQTIVSDPVIPEHLKKWNTTRHWQESKALFLARKAAGFPGAEPIA